MRSTLVPSLALAPLAALLAVAAPAPAAAQRVAPAAATPAISITPYAGVAVFGDLTGGSLGVGLSTSAGTVYGAQVAIPFSSRASLVANAAYGSGNISYGIPVVGGVTLGTTQLVLADADLELALTDPGQLIAGVRPFVQVGGGVMRRRISGFGLGTEATDPSFNAGLGADLAIGRTAAVRFMAKDYIGRFDLEQATSIPMETSMTHNWMLTAGLKLDL